MDLVFVPMMQVKAFNQGEQIFSSRKFVTQGLISNSSDKDIFRFTIDTRQQVILQADPASVGPNNAGSNLDIQIQLFKNVQTHGNDHFVEKFVKQ